MIWTVKYLQEAIKDIERLGQSQRILVDKAIKKVKTNPLPQSEGGYGKPLGSKHSYNLSGFLKIKLLKEGLRIVYKLEKVDSQMLIVVVGVRSDDEVYDLAAARKNKHDFYGGFPLCAPEGCGGVRLKGAEDPPLQSAAGCGQSGDGARIAKGGGAEGARGHSCQSLPGGLS